MKNYVISFLHTDGSKREVSILAYNEERARIRFEIDWGLDMKILSCTMQLQEFSDTNKLFKIISEFTGKVYIEKFNNDVCEETPINCNRLESDQGFTAFYNPCIVGSFTIFVDERPKCLKTQLVEKIDAAIFDNNGDIDYNNGNIEPSEIYFEVRCGVSIFGDKDLCYYAHLKLDGETIFEREVRRKRWNPNAIHLHFKKWLDKVYSEL